MKVSGNSVISDKSHYEGALQQAPNLEQIIKPENINIRQFQINPRPHPPISRNKMLKMYKDFTAGKPLYM